MSTEQDPAAQIFHSLSFEVTGQSEAELDVSIGVYLGLTADPDGWTIVLKEMSAGEVDTISGTIIEFRANVQAARVAGGVPWTVVPQPPAQHDH